MSPPTPSRRHVWVDVSGGYTCPGLVMAWRRAATGWEAQVAVVRDRTVFVQWVPADALHPVVDDAWGPGPGPTPRRGPPPPSPRPADAREATPAPGGVRRPPRRTDGG